MAACLYESKEYTEAIETLYSLMRQFEENKLSQVLDDESTEVVGLFGLLPTNSKDQYTMLLFEILRIHSKSSSGNREDCRNALKICEKLATMNP